jgi:hypothetical protein
VTSLEAKVSEILYILKGSSPKKVAKAEKVNIPAGEIVTVVSDIKKAPKKAAAVKEVVAKKATTKKPAAKKVVKKVIKKK